MIFEYLGLLPLIVLFHLSYRLLVIIRMVFIAAFNVFAVPKGMHVGGLIRPAREILL
jgi:hypothetical protein